MRPRLLIFCTLYDSDHPAFADGGTVYTGYLCKCHRCSGAGVSDIRAGVYPFDRDTGLFSQSAKIIPITILVALWSAGRGVLSVTAGLNCIYGNTETRNYVYLRLRASLYTVIFILAIVLSLVLSVFGNSISAMIYKHAPFWSTLMQYIIKIRTVMTLAVLTVFWDLVYKYLPNRRATQKTTLRKQLPGAVFTACGWLLISFIFSIYLDIFEGFSDMYGSMTTIVLIMLWLYLCMYVILLGGEVNALLEKYLDNHKNCDKIIK